MSSVHPYGARAAALRISVRSCRDIPDDRRRTKLAEHLENFGRRVQLSVFECLLEEKQVERMQAGIVRLIEEEEDTVRIYRLCAACEERVEILGRGVRSEDPDVYIV